MSKLSMIIFLSAAASLVGCAGEGPKQTGGTLLGGATGALLGAQFGGGTGQLLTTAIGAVGGAMAGSAVGKNMDDQDKKQARR